MALNATFDAALSRVRLTGTVLDDGTTALFERSLNEISWTTVRGGSESAIDGSDEAAVDDYEFTPNVVNYYRVSDDSNTFTTSITPSQSGVWLKSIYRPYLNRLVKVVEYSDVVRPARNGVFQGINASYPIAITMTRGSRRWNLTIKADSLSEAESLDLMLSTGDPLFIQTDGLNGIPGGHVVIGDTVQTKFGHVSPRRRFELPLTEVRAPGPDVVGYTTTWATLVSSFATWADVVAEPEFPVWEDVPEYVADPSVVIVP